MQYITTRVGAIYVDMNFFPLFSFYFTLFLKKLLSSAVSVNQTQCMDPVLQLNKCCRFVLIFFLIVYVESSCKEQRIYLSRYKIDIRVSKFNWPTFTFSLLQAKFPFNPSLGGSDRNAVADHACSPSRQYDFYFF